MTKCTDIMVLGGETCLVFISVHNGLVRGSGTGDTDRRYQIVSGRILSKNLQLFFSVERE